MIRIQNWLSYSKLLKDSSWIMSILWERMELSLEDIQPLMILSYLSHSSLESTVKLPQAEEIFTLKTWEAQLVLFWWFEIGFSSSKEWCFRWDSASSESIRWSKTLNFKFSRVLKEARALLLIQTGLGLEEIQLTITLWVRTLKWAIFMRRLPMIKMKIRVKELIFSRMLAPQTELGLDFQLKDKWVQDLKFLSVTSLK